MDNKDLFDERYEDIRKIAKGNMGILYGAYDNVEKRIVALKLLITSYTNEEDRKRFKREFEALVGLEHPHIIPVYTYEEGEIDPYIVMEFAEGKSLRDMLNSG